MSRKKKGDQSAFEQFVADFIRKPDNLEYLPTGLYMVNLVLSGKTNGGIPSNMITHWWGSDGTGKTTLALSTMGLLLERGGRGMLIDTEGRITRDWAGRFGVTFTNNFAEYKQGGICLRIASNQGRPLSLEEVLKNLEIAVHPDTPADEVPDLIVLDSVGACRSNVHYEGSPEDSPMAPEARNWSKRLSIIQQYINIHNTALILLNHESRLMTGGIISGSGSRIPHAASINARFTEKYQRAQDREVGAPIIVTTNTKNTVGGLLWDSAEWQIVGRLPLPLNTAFDLIMTGRRCLFATKTGRPYGGNGNIYTPRFLGDEDVENYVLLGDSIAKATAMLARKPELAEELGKIFDADWRPSYQQAGLVFEEEDEAAEEPAATET